MSKPSLIGLPPVERFEKAKDLALIKSLIISARPLADLSPQGLILSRGRAKSEGLLALHLQKLNYSFFAFMKYHH